jgi:hypothetical protein
MCGEVKPLSEYYENNTGKDGHESNCKPCRLKQNRTRYRKKRPAKAIEIRAIKCMDCVFLRECRDQIKRRTFTPYCFVTAKYHQLFIDEYKVKEVAA